MTLIWLCRYLCLMFCVMAVAAMSATVVEGNESFRQVAVVVVMVLAVFSGIVSVVLGRLFKKDPDRPVFQSRAAIALAMALAILGTMMLAG